MAITTNDEMLAAIRQLLNLSNVRSMPQSSIAVQIMRLSEYIGRQVFQPKSSTVVPRLVSATHVYISNHPSMQMHPLVDFPTDDKDPIVEIINATADLFAFREPYRNGYWAITGNSLSNNKQDTFITMSENVILPEITGRLLFGTEPGDKVNPLRVATVREIVETARVNACRRLTEAEYKLEQAKLAHAQADNAVTLAQREVERNERMLKQIMGTA